MKVSEQRRDALLQKKLCVPKQGLIYSRIDKVPELPLPILIPEERFEIDVREFYLLNGMPPQDIMVGT
jgi:hypothetical protein